MNNKNKVVFFLFPPVMKKKSPQTRITEIHSHRIIRNSVKVNRRIRIELMAGKSDLYAFHF